MIIRPFCPSGTTYTVAVGATSARQKLFEQGSSVNQVRIFNEGTATVWIEFGDSNVTAASATDYPIGPNREVILTVPPHLAGPVFVAVVAAAATGNVYFTPGMGIS